MTSLLGAGVERARDPVHGVNGVNELTAIRVTACPAC
jgi:hypothetical protein